MESSTLNSVADFFLSSPKPDPSKIEAALTEWRKVNSKLVYAKQLLAISEQDFSNFGELQEKRNNVSTLELEFTDKLNKVNKEFQKFQQLNELVYSPLKEALEVSCLSSNLVEFQTFLFSNLVFVRRSIGVRKMQLSMLPL